MEAVLIGGIALQTFGQMEADKAQAKAERQNAEFFKIQKAQAEAATRRALDIFETESEAFIGDQYSSFARAGVDVTGSALLTIAGTKAAQGRERNAIIQEGKVTAMLAGMRADQSDRTADTLTSAGMMGLRLGTGLVQASSAFSKGGSAPQGNSLLKTDGNFTGTIDPKFGSIA